MRSDPPSPLRRRRQAGSAYLVTLLALVVLTIVGLSLVLVTQSEMQVGSNERTVQKIFYAADSGIAAATARALVSFEYRPKTITLADTQSGPLVGAQHQIKLERVYPILDTVCNMCQVNNAGSYGVKNYRRVNFAITSTAERLAGGRSFAEKTVAAILEVQPREVPPETYIVDNKAELNRLKF